MSKDYFQIDQADWDDLKGENERLKAELGEHKRFIAESATTGFDLCQQLGTHRPIPNTGCFGDTQCLNCYKIGFLINEKSKARMAELESQLELACGIGDKLKVRIAQLETLINNPHTDNFIESVILEAAHQQLRWGTAHDAGKEPQDWFWLIGYLSGKAVAAFIGGNMEKGKHHIISSAAALLNWFRHATGEMTHMQPSSQRAIEKADGT